MTTAAATVSRLPASPIRVTLSPMPRVLHLLSQRPSLTGSGVTLDALVRHAGEADWDQHVVVGIPAGEQTPRVGDLHGPSVGTVRFETEALPFPVPGMSDVMPYASTRWSAMPLEWLDLYRTRWRQAVATAVAEFAPDIIHSHHVWLMSSLVKDVAPTTPVVTHCHATGLRQMVLCPDLAGDIRRGCRRNEIFAVLHTDHADQLARWLEIDAARIRLVGAGYRDELFHRRRRAADPGRRLLYIGKYADAKGLPWLLDAFEIVHREFPDAELHIAGSGAGEEADGLRRRMEGMAPAVILHGQLDQAALADLMRRSSTCVLPSFFEGVPLVLVEAVACGCRLVTTDLPGVIETIAPHLPGEILEIVHRPRLTGPDTPVETDLPAFTKGLAAAIERSLAAPPPGVVALDSFSWRAVFQRVEHLWRELLGPDGG